MSEDTRMAAIAKTPEATALFVKREAAALPRRQRAQAERPVLEVVEQPFQPISISGQLANVSISATAVPEKAIL